MKEMIKLPAIVLGLLLLLTGTTQKVMAQDEEVSLQSFYDELSPYGQWINDPQYGYVWRPDVDQAEFRPYYTNGRWVMTEYGNTWVSNYNWGWAPFHYGRWVYNRYNNWIWIPDTVWGPAWVSWRSGGGYYGWAPLGPSISIGINIGRGGYRIPDMCWNFIPYSNIYYSSYPRYYWSRNRVYIQKTVIIHNTYVRNNRTYYTGPRVDEVRRATNQNVRVYNVTRTNRPGTSRIDNNSVNIYNPRPNRSVSNSDAAPRNVVRGNINRGPVSRDARTTVNNNQMERGNLPSNRGERNDRINERPTRSGNVNPASQNRGSVTRGESINREPANTTRPEMNNARSSRSGAQRSEVQQREMPQQAERVQQAPQERRAPARSERVERPQPQRVERRESAPQQRMERPRQTQPQRVERSSPPAQRSSGKARESHGESRGGRPGRG